MALFRNIGQKLIRSVLGVEGRWAHSALAGRAPRFRMAAMASRPHHPDLGVGDWHGS